MTCLPCEVSCLPRYSQQHKRCNNGKGRPNHLDLQSKACSSHCFESKLEWIDLEGASRRYNGLFPFEQKFRKISKWGQMVRKFPGKVSVKSGNYWISEKQTIHPIIRVKSNGTEILGAKLDPTATATGIFHQMERAPFVTPKTNGWIPFWPVTTNACNLMNQSQLKANFVGGAQRGKTPVQLHFFTTLHQLYLQYTLFENNWDTTRVLIGRQVCLDWSMYTVVTFRFVRILENYFTKAIEHFFCTYVVSS